MITSSETQQFLLRKSYIPHLSAVYGETKLGKESGCKRHDGGVSVVSKAVELTYF
jgi:hypothetical protein